MQAQQLLDYIIKPTLKYMGGSYDSKNARMLLLATAAIESKCGYYIKQVDGPALGIWQMERSTLVSMMSNCDALSVESFDEKLGKLAYPVAEFTFSKALLLSPMYACAMARLKYSMDIEPLPDHTNIREVYNYYKRIYNTPLGASTYEKFKQAWIYHKLTDIKL